MNIFDAIMAAADHIEGNPAEFKFSSCQVPSRAHCGTPGCALGWIACFYGKEPGRASYPFMPEFGLPSDAAFYDRMRTLARQSPNPERKFWQEDAGLCAATLRLYAKHYHGHEKVRVPDWEAMAARQTVHNEVSEELTW